MSFPINVELRGSGSFVPPWVVRNDHFAAKLDTDDEWIVTRTGIRERRWASEGETTSTLATRAAEIALKDAGLRASDLDAIICATATGDHPFPSTACFVQHALSAGTVPAFDIAAACAGFLYASFVACSMIGSGAFENILVVGAETLSRFADPEDRRTVVLLGDGAGAVVYGKGRLADQGLLYAEMGSDGSKADLIIVPAGGSRLPASSATVAERMHYMRMKGREVYRFAVEKMMELIDRSLDKAGMKPSDLKMVIPHQSNLRIIESVREKMDLPIEKIAINIDRFGNTSAASIPLALHENRQNGTLVPGDCVLLIALGAGLTWSSVVLRL